MPPPLHVTAPQFGAVFGVGAGAVLALKTIGSCVNLVRRRRQHKRRNRHNDNSTLSTANPFEDDDGHHHHHHQRGTMHVMNNQSKGRIRGGDSTGAQQQTSSAAGDMRATAWMTPAILLTLLVVATLVYTGRTARVPAACALGAIGAYIMRAFAKEVRNNEGAAATGDAGGVVLTPHADTGLATSEDWRASLPGTWRKDRAASESMDLACDAIKLNGLLRRATVLINGLELEVRDNNVLRFSVTSVIPFYKVTEWYTVDGVTVSRGNRRDMRRGGYTGTATARRGGDGVDLRVKWGDPHGGEVIDELRVSADGQKLFVTSSMRMKTGLVVPPYTAVYHRVR